MKNKLLTINAIIPIGKPTAIITPKSTPNILDTNTEPDDGGMNAKLVAKPANNGIT